MSAKKQFQCPHCKHQPFASVTELLAHRAAKHPKQAAEQYPPSSVYHALARRK